MQPGVGVPVNEINLNICVAICKMVTSLQYSSDKTLVKLS